MLRILILFFIAFFLQQGEVKAQTCFVSTSALNFGTTNVAANINYNATANINYTCFGTANATIRVCTNLGGGSGGTLTGAPRQLVNGANKLNYNLYTTGALSNIHGSFVWPFAGSYPGSKDVISLGAMGFVTFSRTIYGRVLAGQTNVVPGTYTSSFSGHTLIGYDYSPATACTTSPATSTTTNFNVTAVVPAACVVSATTMDFGTQAVLVANVDSTSTITTQCTNSTPYSISLNGGSSGAVNPLARKMVSGANSVLYGLYRDAARTLPWGNSIGTNTQAGSGTGGNQSVTVYGRIAPQITPINGTYLDTITVTVTY